MGEWQGPESQIGGRVGDRAEHVLHGVDGLVDADLAELLLIVTATAGRRARGGNVAVGLWQLAAGLLPPLAPDQDRLGQKHPRDTHDANKQQERLEALLSVEQVAVAVLLARSIAFRVAVHVLQEEHIDEDEEQRRRAVGAVADGLGIIWGHFERSAVHGPFEKAEHAEPAKQAEQEKHLWQEHGEQVRELLEVPVVEDGQDDAEQHLQHAEQHRDLHLEGVLEGDPVGGDLPDGIEAEAVRSAVEAGAVLWR